jgi:hypothetical protein
MQQVIELGTKTEMMEQFPLIQQLYPDYTIEKYADLLAAMLPNNYIELII